MIQYNSYKFRIYPTKEQEEQLFKTIGCARKVYNELLAQSLENYDKYSKKEITEDEYKALMKNVQYSRLKTIYPYLKEVDSLALANAKNNLDTAYKNFYQGKSERPVFKKKNVHKWSYTTNVSNKNKPNIKLMKNGYLKLPKLKEPVKIKNHRNTKGVLKSITITKQKNNHWYASLKYEQNIKTPNYHKSINSINNPGAGDLGLKDLMTLDNGVIIENIKTAYKYKEDLAKAQKIMSRRREQAKKDGKRLSDAKNYQKTKLKVARIHDKIKRVREDYLHKITHYIVNNYDCFVLEDLHSSNMMKNHNLAFSIQDVSWNKLVNFLTYKMFRKGGSLIIIDQFYASTQECSNCHSITGPKGFDNLNVRKWECSHCGAYHHRDVNAARNILMEGLRLLNDVFDRWGNGDFYFEKSRLVNKDLLV